MTVRRPFTPKGGSEKRAVDSNRHHNIPLYASMGEIVDNSIEWGAQVVRIFVSWKRDPKTQPKRIVFIDDGQGMSPEKLSNSLVTGFHEHGDDVETRIGRFGVGCTYAFLANCRRADVYSKEKRGKWHHTVFNVDSPDLEDPTKDFPPDSKPKSPPKEFEKVWSRLKSGTLTIWSDFDLGHVEVDQAEIPFWISRAYRRFIGEKTVTCKKVKEEWQANVAKNSKSIAIYYNDEKLKAYDPLYAIPFRKGDKGGTLYKPIVINYTKPDGSGNGTIRILFGLSPERWRKKSENSPNASAKDSVNVEERLIRGGGQQLPSIADSRKMSICRNGREVSWLQDGFLYGRVDEIDRWWGIEIQYDAELDAVFNVQNVKYQVGLTKELRRKLKQEIQTTVNELRKEVRRVFALDSAAIKKKKRKQEQETEDPITDLLEDEDLEDVGDTDEAPNEFLKKVITNTKARMEILDKLSERKFVDEENFSRRVPKDTNLLFEYHAKGGEVLMTKYMNHPWFEKMVQCEAALKEAAAAGDLTPHDLEDHYHEIRILWNILLSMLVISLATVSPNQVAQKHIDKVLSRWGELTLAKVEKRDELQGSD